MQNQRYVFIIQFSKTFFIAIQIFFGSVAKYNTKVKRYRIYAYIWKKELSEEIKDIKIGNIILWKELFDS